MASYIAFATVEAIYDAYQLRDFFAITVEYSLNRIRKLEESK